MPEEKQEQQEAHKNPEENSNSENEGVEEQGTEENEELTDEQIADLKKRAEVSSQNFERAKKAEEELKKYKSSEEHQAQQSEAPKKTDEGLSTKDVIFLAKQDVHDDDMDELLEYSKFKGVSVSEAHKQLKPLLDAREEERKSAQVSHTKGGARGASKTDGESLLKKAEETGEIPTDPEKIKAMNEARIARMKNRK